MKKLILTSLFAGSLALFGACDSRDNGNYNENNRDYPGYDQQKPTRNSSEKEQTSTTGSDSYDNNEDTRLNNNMNPPDAGKSGNMDSVPNNKKEY